MLTSPLTKAHPIGTNRFNKLNKCDHFIELLSSSFSAIFKIIFPKLQINFVQQGNFFKNLNEGNGI